MYSEGIASDSITGFTFTEVSSVRASGSKVVCCHFSSDGKLLASGSHDKKVYRWMGFKSIERVIAESCLCCRET